MEYLICFWNWLTTSFWGGVIVTSIVLPLCFWWGNRMFNHLWPSSDERDKEWMIRTSYDEKRELAWNRVEGWRSPELQKNQVWFEVNLRKGRVIKAIEFDDGYINELPLKCHMFIRTTTSGFAFFSYGVIKKIIQGRILVDLQKAQKIQFIRVIIDMPEVSQYWAIKKIKLKEVRIPHLWEPIIK